MKKTLIPFIILICIFSCTKYELLDTLDAELKSRLRAISPTNSESHFILPNSSDLRSIPQSEHNPLTYEKVELGKLLFFETGFAQSPRYPEGQGTYSCATCHVPEMGFVPGNHQGIADGGLGFAASRFKSSQYNGNEIDAQGARPLSVLNVAYVTNTMWNGKFGANHANVGTEHVWEEEKGTRNNFLGFDGLEAQNIEGVITHRMVYTPESVADLGYKEMFDAAFEDIPTTERYSELTASFALSAYLRTLLTTDAPFQNWLKGDEDAMTDRQKKGAMLFFGKAGCYRCHQGPALNAVKFYALGVRDLHEYSGTFNTSADDKRNLGRGGFTQEEADLYKFKVPQLYNLKNAGFYFHGSSKNNIWGVVEYFNEAIPENPEVPASQIAAEFHPLDLTTIEIDALVNFLEDGLLDPNVERFVPQEVISGYCFPNNDYESKEALGCN